MKVRLTRELYLHGVLHKPGDVIQLAEADINPSMERLDGKGAKPVVPTEDGGPDKEGTLDTLAEMHAKHVVPDTPPAVQPQAAAPKEQMGSMSAVDRNRELLAVLGSLDEHNPDLWDAHGKPKVREVEKLAGFDTSREELDQIAPNIRIQR